MSLVSLHLTYWLLIVVTFGVHDDIGGTQKTHYATDAECKAAGRAVVAQYPDARINFGCEPIYVH